MKNMKLIGLLVILLVGGPTVLAQTEQPPLLHRGDAARSGVIDQPPVRTFSDVRWQIETPDPGYSSPLVTDQTLYIGSLGGTVLALDTTTGEEIWSVQPIDGAVSPIQLRGASELVLTIGASLVVMDRESGTVEWQFDADGEVWFSPPLIVDTVAYFGSAAQTYYALDLETHAVLWQITTGFPIFYAGAAWEDTLIFSGQNHLVGLNRLTGEKIWQADLPSADWGPYALADGKLFAGALDGSFYALDVTSGAIVWRARVGMVARPVWSPPIVDEGGAVIAGYSDGTLYAFDRQSGDTLWTFEAEAAATGEPILAGDVVYFGLGAHSNVADDAALPFYAVDASTGLELWHYTMTGPIYTSPAVGDGAIFVATAAGHLYALE